MGIAVGRVLAVTAGGYLRLASHGLQEGEVVFIVLGVSIPFVLRPTGDEFVLRGKCYVPGIMVEEITRDEAISVRDVILR